MKKHERHVAIACLFTTAAAAHAGAFSGENTVNAHLTVNAAASCNGTVAELALTNNIPANRMNDIGYVTVTCPGAVSVYIGFVADDGKVYAELVRPANVKPPSTGPAKWLDGVVAGSVSATLHAAGGFSELPPATDATNGLPPYVSSLWKIDGPAGEFRIQASFQVPGTAAGDPVHANSGSWPYTMKIYGYWQ